MDVPMLDETEWDYLHGIYANNVLPLLNSSNKSLTRPAIWKPFLDAYYKITGFLETEPNAIWHHRLSLYGPNCVACDKPLRSPGANFCAACGNPAKGEEQPTADN